MKLPSKLRLHWPARIIAVVTLLCGAKMNAAAASPAAGQERFYIGTYTWSSSLGIYQSSLDLGTGKVGPTNLAGATGDPSFVALHPSHNFLYAVNEGAGTVVAFSVNPATGNLTVLNQQSSGGSAPCHVVVDRTGKNVLVANYGGGSVTVLPIQADGKLGTATAHIQHSGSNPHAHCTALDASNHFALVCDLGLDKIMCYVFDPARGTLTTNLTPWTSVAPGSGPRHLAFDPQCRHAYVICELSSTIVAFNYDREQGVLKEFQTISTLPSGWSGQNSTAEIAVHPSGKFLYGSNRGYNSVAVFAVEALSGTLTPIQQQPTGRTPRNFAIDPTGSFCLVANQDSDNVQVYAIDPQSGRLTPTGQNLVVSKPVCVLPFITQPPQPVLSAQTTSASTLQVGIGNALASLAYQLDHTPDLQPGTKWGLLASGLTGQTNFILTNTALQGFIRASVITNW